MHATLTHLSAHISAQFTYNTCSSEVSGRLFFFLSLTLFMDGTLFRGRLPSVTLSSITLSLTMTRSAMQSLDRHMWRSRITNKTKLHLYRVFILPIMLYEPECWAINKADIQRIDAVDQWCLRRILDIRWHDFVRHADIRHITNQSPLSSIIKSCRLTFVLHEWMRTQMLAKLSSNLLQRTGGDHRGGRAQPG